MPIEAITAGMIDLSIPIREFTAEGAPSAATATRLGMNGVELRCDQVPPGRYAWLGFDVGGSPVKALGEIVGVMGEGGAHRVLVRFKHLFPRDRMLLAQVLDTRAAA